MGLSVRDAMRLTPRVGHLPADQRRFASLDRPLPIGYGQTNSQPRTVRSMLNALDVREGQRVLDLGCGSGWTTVILARLVGPTGTVLGVERVRELTIWGAANVAAAGLTWARVIGAQPDQLGAPAYGPFDRILVSAEARSLPGSLVTQLAPDGVMVIPVRGELWRVHANGVVDRLGFYVFVPLIEHGQS